MKKTTNIRVPAGRLTMATLLMVALSCCRFFDSSEEGNDYVYGPISSNLAPIAVVGVSSTRVLLDGTVSLSGEASYDPDGAALRYRWEFATRPEGSSAALNDVDQMVATFIADEPGEYVVRLTVSDGDLAGSAAKRSSPLRCRRLRRWNRRVEGPGPSCGSPGRTSSGISRRMPSSSTVSRQR